MRAASFSRNLLIQGDIFEHPGPPPKRRPHQFPRHARRDATPPYGTSLNETPGDPPRRRTPERRPSGPSRAPRRPREHPPGEAPLALAVAEPPLEPVRGAVTGIHQPSSRYGAGSDLPHALLDEGRDREGQLDLSVHRTNLSRRAVGSDAAGAVRRGWLPRATRPWRVPRRRDLPSRPGRSSKRTLCPSPSVVSPALSTAEMWTKASLDPSSGAMNP